MMLAILLPMLALVGIILAHFLRQMSGIDRLLFGASLITMPICIVVAYRMRLGSSWRATLLLVGPAALSVYSFTHSAMSIVSGIAIPLLFGMFGGGGAPGRADDERR